MKALPFKVDRKSPGGLVGQLAGGLRHAILSGYYRPGENLPTLRELAATTGTSLRVPREAIGRLRQEGLVDPRRSLGCMVVGKRNPLWLGHVLFVLGDADGSYYANVFSGKLQQRLIAAGYLFTRVSVIRRNGNPGIGALEAALAQNVTLAVLFCGRGDQVQARLAREGIPFVSVGEQADRPAGDFIRFSRDAALADFVAHCRSRKIRKVLQAGFEGEGGLDAAPALKAAGIQVARVACRPKAGPGRLESIQRRSLAFFSRAGRIDADLVLFTDDFLAMGALQGLLASGTRVPQDMRVATMANAGFGPVFPVTLTRFEMDPVAHGETAARLLLARLAGKPLPADAELRSVYVKGRSFP